MNTCFVLSCVVMASVMLNTVVHVCSKNVNENLVKQEPRMPSVLEKFFRIHKIPENQRHKFEQIYENPYLFKRTIQELFEWANCKPRLIPVKLQKESFKIAYPDYTYLHRCTGGCLRGALVHCVPVETTEIVGKVYGIETNFKRKKRSPLVDFTMLNHTKCDCNCITQPSDCDDATEIFNSDSCSCECKDLSHTCDKSIKKWDPYGCRCKCIAKATVCIDGKLWDPDTCQCECNQQSKDICLARNQFINPETCDCYCSLDTYCADGKMVSSHDCSCV